MKSWRFPLRAGATIPTFSADLAAGKQVRNGLGKVSGSVVLPSPPTGELTC